MALPGYLTLKGQKQGVIKGSCDQEGHEGAIVVQAFSHEVSIPREAHTGLASGKRVHHPLVVVKPVDKSSPLLYQALTSYEPMSVEIKWYRVGPTGQEEHYFTTALDGAVIVSIKPFMKDCFDKAVQHVGQMEEVAFSYRKAIWRWVPDGIESEDDWRSPKD